MRDFGKARTNISQRSYFKHLPQKYLQWQSRYNNMSAYAQRISKKSENVRYVDRHTVNGNKWSQRRNATKINRTTRGNKENINWLYTTLNCFHPLSLSLTLSLSWFNVYFSNHALAHQRKIEFYLILSPFIWCCSDVVFMALSVVHSFERIYVRVHRTHKSGNQRMRTIVLPV